MKPNTIIKFLLVCGLSAIPSVLSAESLTLTTYYPAPFGAYDRLRLVPRESLPLDPHCDDEKDLGLMYYDNGLDERGAGLYVCHKMSEEKFMWILVSRPLSSGDEGVRNEKVVCLKESGKFGVCLNNPSQDGTCACQ